ncbi:hypothetical protein CO038_04220 [Candidatus Pacearchaeota archaeon CG_4_9_14_0_2_um_filter_39_13]|nr:hypothetical protein [Candidatus Pacearchaeota archaeon]OIO44100.1 MAG: hypothetical protein AUJ64_00575 [Candidatus Pacearchaeota archaeon CG1_02_39_14]PJC44389.1 MAG: hypothetical protein CO038_04220 [Candidatus Pacearchaeota archaeon CG_4_9_14_0_2_um_filter_39_13]
MVQKNRRFSTEEILLIKRLTDEGKSLNYLSRLFSVGKSTLYYQIRKFKPRIKKEFLVRLSDFHIGELIGAFAGDGNYSHQRYDRRFPSRPTHHRIRYFLTFSKEREYAEYLKNLLAKLNLNPYIMNRNESVLILTVNSKEYIDFIKTYLTWDKDKTFSIRLKKNISEYSDNFLRGFARGLMDTDGFLNPGNAVCACISKELINNLSEIFTSFDLNIKRRVLIRKGNSRPLYFVRVRRKSLERYGDVIGFSNKAKAQSLDNIINGDRKP